MGETALGIVKGDFGRVVLLDLPASLVRHAHHHCHVILKVGGPSCGFGIGDRVYPLDSDTAILVNSWEEHFYEFDSRRPRAQFLALYVEPQWLAQIDRALARADAPSFFSSPCVPITSRTRVLADRLTEILQTNHHGAHSRTEETIFDLIISLAERSSSWRSQEGRPAFIKTASDHRIRRALAYMRANLSTVVSLDQVAEVACLSRPHFNVLFKRQTGVSPSVYANSLRVEHAIDRLSHEREPVGGVANDLGFRAPGNFTRFFAQHVGAGPREFRTVLSHIGS